MAARSGRGDQTRGGAAIGAASQCDVAVVGGGAAGLWTALRAAERGAAVCLISRTPLSLSASFWAQGGLAAALEAGDSPAQHAADTIAAGRGLCRPSAVQALVEEAPDAVRELQRRGVEFDLEPDGELALGLEGGHTRRRIVHAGGSQTGHEISSKLAAMVAEEARIAVRERTSAVALWSDGERCHGLLTEDDSIAAAATVLATGGAAALWRRTTNPWGAIGAGPSLALAAGAELADLEFCQFHPTALALPGSRHDGMLVTEAVRGEGATLLDACGRRFTDELAPRDAVTAAILDRIEADGADSVRLDLRELDPARFPNVFASLVEAGLDPAAAPGPVAPAAHD
ncbi:MAG: FAD-dependent oxidoreductase, partial [Solirubrobacterales bacterium]